MSLPSTNPAASLATLSIGFLLAPTALLAQASIDAGSTIVVNGQNSPSGDWISVLSPLAAGFVGAIISLLSVFVKSRFDKQQAVAKERMDHGVKSITSVYESMEAYFVAAKYACENHFTEERSDPENGPYWTATSVSLASILRCEEAGRVASRAAAMSRIFNSEAFHKAAVNCQLALDRMRDKIGDGYIPHMEAATVALGALVEASQVEFNKLSSE